MKRHKKTIKDLILQEGQPLIVNQTLDLSHKSLNSFEGIEYLEQTERVKRLLLNHNLFIDIPEDLFSKFSLVEELYFNNNKLDYLPNDFCQQFPHLQVLNLANNCLIEVSKQDFSSLTNLIKLILSPQDIRDDL